MLSFSIILLTILINNHIRLLELVLRIKLILELAIIMNNLGHQVSKIGFLQTIMFSLQQVI
jgi:hypothetical protein